MSRKIRGIYQADAEKLLTYFRKLVLVDPERVETVDDAQRMTVQDEEKWILSRHKKILAGDIFVSCLEINNSQIVALGEVERLPRPIESHMGEIRLGILPEYAECGYEMVRSLCHHAWNMGMENLIYAHLETQKIGIDIMKNCGFLQVGYIPDYYKRDNAYVGRIILLLHKFMSH